MASLQRRIRTYLQQQGSPMAPYTGALMRASRRYGVDPRIIVAISGAETSFGKAGNGPSVHNAWGIGPGRAYKNWGEGFNEIAKLLKTGYLSEGRTSFSSIYPKYVWGRSDREGDPNEAWIKNTTAAYSALGGDPAKLGGYKAPKGQPRQPKAGRGSTGLRPLSVDATAPVTPFGGGAGVPNFALQSLGRIARGGSAVGAFRSMLAAPEHWAATHPQAAPAAPGQRPAAPGQRPNRPQQQGGRVVDAPKIGNLVQPMVTKMPGGSEYAYVDAEGAPDRSGVRHHGGKDWFAPGGSRVVAPIGGKIVEVTASRGNSGQVFGGVVKIQDRNGRVYVFRHVDPRGVKVGQQVKPGTVVATVSPWTDGSPHAHIEIWKTYGGGYTYENMIDPATVFGGK